LNDALYCGDALSLSLLFAEAKALLPQLHYEINLLFSNEKKELPLFT